jgi:hypothetical protein
MLELLLALTITTTTSLYDGVANPVPYVKPEQIHIKADQIKVVRISMKDIAPDR